ncbi:MAG: gliding motility-associated C-terminal domain-containing protein [Bacteroidia bacterium]
MNTNKLLTYLCVALGYVATHTSATAQNLVVNPSFETTTSNCANFGGEGFSADLTGTWDDANSGGDSCSSPDLFSSCNLFAMAMPNSILGYQYSRSGTRHAGIITYAPGIASGCTAIGSDNYREYIEGKTTTPLMAGQQYCVSMYVSLADDVVWATNNIGIYFSNTLFQRNACNGSHNSIITTVTPQLNYSCAAITDTSNWVRIQWTYTAVGGEQFFTIGNFFNNGATTVACTNSGASLNPYAYYFIDDVSITANTCCYADIIAPLTICSTDPNVTLTANEGSTPTCVTSTTGTWGGGAYISATGVFNPAVAGVGAHTVTYTLACGYVATTTITVKACASLVVCKNSNGSLQVTGGTSPYTWEKIVRIQDCSSFICQFSGCDPAICTTYVTTYVNISNTNTATPTVSTDSIRIKDNAGNELLIYDQSTLPACSGCALVASIQTKTDATCGANNGSATVTTTGATYSWNTTPVQTTQTATALPAGTYICTVTQGSCTDTAKVTITSSANIVANITAQSPATCGTSNGTAVATFVAGATYSWNTTPIQTNDTAIGLAAGTYVCTVTQGTCSDTAKVTIIASANLVANATGVNASCGNANGSATVDVLGATYSWNTTPVQTTQTITGLNAGTYICTVSQGACSDTAQVTITNSANMVITITGDTTICANGTTTLTASAPSATSYSWNTSPVQTTPAITVTPSMSTYYTVTASNGTCSGTQTVHVNALSAASAYILGDTLVCLGEPVALTASTGTSYAWTPGGATAQSIVFVANTPATYSVIVTNATAPAACQTSTATISIKIYPYANTLNAGADQTISIGQGATLTATGATNGYTWNTNETTPSINVTPLKTTVYTVKSTDTFGCVTRDSVRVTVDLNCGDLFIATAFSPNDDGANDIECVLGSCVTAVSWAIYDRWGEKVFESNAVADCWNGTYKGKPLNTGVYVYKLTATLRSGETVSKNGNITLTR